MFSMIIYPICSQFDNFILFTAYFVKSSVPDQYYPFSHVFRCHSTEKGTRYLVVFHPQGWILNIHPQGWILNIQTCRFPRMGASPQTPQLRGAARHYAVHQVEPYTTLVATKKQERMVICGVQLGGQLNIHSKTRENIQKPWGQSLVGFAHSGLPLGFWIFSLVFS